jgi:hypothetical protein
VAFFNESVEFPARRSIKATYLDPPEVPGISARRSEEIPVATFADAWSNRAWADFCGAFA